MFKSKYFIKLYFTLFIMTQLVYLNVLISLYEFNIWLDGYIWWKFCVNSPLRNPLTDKNADVSNTYFPRCIYHKIYNWISKNNHSQNK